MESTGVYWQPVYNLLEGEREVLVVNAQHLKAVPGRKTDVKDAERIAQLLQHGLLKGNFPPPQPQRGLRGLTRYGRTWRGSGLLKSTGSHTYGKLYNVSMKTLTQEPESSQPVVLLRCG
jgi:hypothetical protein